jgi:hypothetical protein
VGKKRRRKNLLEITAIANTQQLSPDESKGGAVPEKTNTKKKKKRKKKETSASATFRPSDERSQSLA